MTPSKWSNVQVAVQSALATAIVITAITKANPAVVSYTGTDPTNGDFIAVTALGMRQVDARVFRIANVNGAGNTLELEAIDSTSFDTFTSGSAQVVTFGTSLGTVSGLSASGGDFDFIDITATRSCSTAMSARRSRPSARLSKKSPRRWSSPATAPSAPIPLSAYE